MNQPPSAPPSNMGSPQPQATRRVRWLPVLIMVLLPFGIVALGLGQFWWPEYQQNQVKKIGIQTTAKIIAIEPTGNLYNNQPQVLLTLLVHPMQGEDFTAQAKMVVNQVYIPQVQPGATVKVYYDPNDHSKIAVE
jgi:hypothetical protein